MKMINDRAIELSEQYIGSAAIPGHRLSGPVCDFSEIAVGRFDRGDATRGCQVQTISEVKDGAENEGFIELAAFFLLVSKFQPSERIGLPEIDPRSEPIPFVLARGKLGRPIQKSFGYVRVTSVIAKDERSREMMQRRTQSSGVD